MNIKKIKIGNVELENNIILAPMAGITDSAFRKITKEIANPGLVVTEMISAKALFYNDLKTINMIDLEGEKRPIAVQLFGNDIPSIIYSVQYLQDKCDIIDFNLGCPAPKIVKNNEGSKLLLDLKLVEKILKNMAENSKIPVTVKIRKGFNNENIVACVVAKIAEDCGISGITVHGRTRGEFFCGDVDLEIIKKVKESVKIPVIGNGNINSIQKAEEMFNKTNCDGIMIGRASMGNPFVLKSIIENKIYKPTREELLNIILKHYKLIINSKGQNTGIHEMRKFVSYYVKGLENAKYIRENINTMENKNEIFEFLKENV
jgi:tRNA-dihydrouridine synthase B